MRVLLDEVGVGGGARDRAVELVENAVAEGGDGRGAEGSELGQRLGLC